MKQLSNENGLTVKRQLLLQMIEAELSSIKHSISLIGYTGGNIINQKNATKLSISLL